MRLADDAAAQKVLLHCCLNELRDGQGAGLVAKWNWGV